MRIGFILFLPFCHVRKKISYRQFSKAREYVRQLKLKNVTEWRHYAKSGNKPEDIPSHPDIRYKEEWKGWSDWLGMVEKIKRQTSW